MIEKGDGFETAGGGGSPYGGYNNGAGSTNGHGRAQLKGDSPPVSPSPSSPTSSPKPRSSPLSSHPSLYPPPLSAPFPPTSSPFPMPPFSRGAGDYLLASPGLPDLHYTGRPQSYSMISPNDPTANACKVVEFHGEKIAAFHIHGKTMLCLPQAFELFLKNLVGGLHTVYTKCKRLDIHPLVCNVEQVRVLRGLGAIQPGVNRCKLITDGDFEELMKDCNTSRPGRPPKRMAPLTTFAPMPNQEPFFAMAGGMPFPPPPSHPHHSPGPGFPHPFMPGMPPGALQAQAAHLLSRNMLPPGNMGNGENMLEKYGNMLRQLQGLKEVERKRSPSPPVQERRLGLHSPVGLNLSYKEETEEEKGGATDELSSDKSESELADIDGDTIDDNISDENSMDCGDSVETKPKPSQNGGPAPLTSMGYIQLMSHIQDLVKTAITNAAVEENQPETREDAEKQLATEKESLENLRKQIGEAQKQSEIYLKRFKKEKRLRRKIQTQLEIECFKKAKLEEALNSLSYNPFLSVKDLGENETNDKENCG